MRTPSARASGLVDLEVVVDTRERYAYRFSTQQVTAVKGPLPCGDYGVRRDGQLVAVVERKSLEDLAGSLVSGRMAAQLAELATVGRAAVVVEECYSRVFTSPHVKPGFLADLLARVQVRWPSVPIFFAETRPLAEEWTYRFLAAAAAESVADDRVAERLAGLSAAGPLRPADPTVADIRRWAQDQGMVVADRGRLRPAVRETYQAAHS